MSDEVLHRPVRQPAVRRLALVAAVAVIGLALASGGVDALATWFEAAGSAPAEAVAALLHAAESGRTVDVDARDAEGRTALMVALEHNPDARVARLLLEAGADANVHDARGMTPLLVALGQRLAASEVEALLAAGADPNPPADGAAALPPLLAAVLSEAPADVVAALVAAGADASGAFGDVALVVALGNVWTPDAADVVAQILAAGADARGVGAFGISPLAAAVVSGRSSDVVAMLIEAGADPSAREPMLWRVVVGELRRAAARDPAVGDDMPTSSESLAYLLGAGDDGGAGDDASEARDADGGWTALHLAAARGADAETLAVLLAGSGEGVDVRDPRGLTPLMVASTLATHDGDGASLVEALLDAGADPAARSERGTTALSVAAALGDVAAVHALVRAGAPLDARDALGMTPLMWAAAASDEPAVLEALLAAGADATLRSSDGNGAFDYARANPALAGAPVVAALRPDRGRVDLDTFGLPPGWALADALSFVASTTCTIDGEPHGEPTLHGVDVSVIGPDRRVRACVSGTSGLARCSEWGTLGDDGRFGWDDDNVEGRLLVDPASGAVLGGSAVRVVERMVEGPASFQVDWALCTTHYVLDTPP